MTDTQEDAGFAEPGPSAARNTDRHLWPMTSDREDADSIHVTADGGIGINVGGHVIVMTLRKWFCAALACNQYSIPSTFEELIALRSQNKVMREALELCEEFFDERADADQPAGCDSPIPNDEMRMLIKVREALSPTSKDETPQ